MENTRVRFGEWISEAWNMLTAKWQTWIAIAFIFLIPVGLVHVFMEYISLKNQPLISQDQLLQSLIDNFTTSLMLGLITEFVSTFVEAFFLGGIFITAFKQMNGEEISPSDIFSGTEYYVNILVASLMISILQFVGVFMCILPALIVQGLFFLTIPLIVRKNLPPLDALSESFNATKNDWVMYTFFAITAAVLSVLGLFACLVGVVFTLPLLFLTMAVAYRDCFEPELRPMSRVDELYSKSCRSCGTSIPVNASYCSKCGASQV